jgi:thiamine biosynthesis lipoprotein
MGCSVIVAGASAAERRAIERLFAERERTFSRFVRGSELNRVNNMVGRRVKVSSAFAEMLGLAFDAKRETSGLVDPMVGAAVEAAGYDRDFAEMTESSEPIRLFAMPSREVMLEGRSVLVPTGVRLDLNGVVKGRTVDDALQLLDGDGFVSAGGDLATRGATVIALPRGGTVSLVRGALATSGTDKRRWLRAGAVQHHLIDPHTGRPSTSHWEQVTVCGASCVAADIAAKAAFLLGARGPAWLDALGLPGRFVSAGGIAENQCWTQAVGQALPCT